MRDAFPFVLSKLTSRLGTLAGNCCLECEIQPDSIILGSEKDQLENAEMEHMNASFDAFCCETRVANHVPRALFSDLEPAVVGRIHTGKYYSLFHPKLVSGKEDTPNSYV